LLEEDPTANVAIESSHCKLFGTTRCWDTVYDALQVAGGAGYLATQPYEKRMRDFRVTTVFEGTTEIHSIYPALFLARKIAKDLQTAHSTSIGRLFCLLKSLFKRIEWPLKFEHQVMKKASKAARINASLIRRMLILGIMIYGSRISRKQFLLRRISTLSLYLFGLLAVLARMSASSELRDLEKEQIDLLDYFLQEAKAVRRQSLSILENKRERLLESIMKHLSSA